MIKRKDNLTDAVENLDKNRNSTPDPKVSEGQVVDSDGQIITLGQNSKKPGPHLNKGKVIELSPEVIEAIGKVVESALEKSLQKFSKNNHE